MKNGLKILIAADAFGNLALGMIGPIYAIFVGKIGGDILDVGWAYFVFTFTSGIVLYMISRWENRIAHKERLVVIGYLINALGCLLYFFVDSQMALLAVQVVLGVGVAIVSPAFDAIYSHYVNSEREASDWGAWEAMGYFVAALGAIAGSVVANSFGFHALFLCMSVAAATGALISFFLFDSVRYLGSSKL
ncbi:MAG: MFS transporter [Candidatus Paceibacterota bacterium]|jgi:DHA1 family florfenicol/chloramphenicol resistance protein-like MFS transporter